MARKEPRRLFNPFVYPWVSRWGILLCRQGRWPAKGLNLAVLDARLYIRIRRFDKPS
jgi:hypothetical protein